MCSFEEKKLIKKISPNDKKKATNRSSSRLMRGTYERTTISEPERYFECIMKMKNEIIIDHQ